MSTITKIFAGLAGVIHVLFFLMESVFWMTPAIHGIFLVESVEVAEALNVYVKNQGYYNLFLALGMFAGIALLSRNRVAGRTLIGFVCLVMIGAALVLRFTIPDMASGPYIQGVAPLIALITLLLDSGRKPTL